MLFRTSKQSFGLQDCASPNLEMQVAHINACLVAYIFLQSYRIKHKHSSVEEALRALRIASLDEFKQIVSAPDYTFTAFA